MATGGSRAAMPPVSPPPWSIWLTARAGPRTGGLRKMGSSLAGWRAPHDTFVRVLGDRPAWIPPTISVFCVQIWGGLAHWGEPEPDRTFGIVGILSRAVSGD